MTTVLTHCAITTTANQMPIHFSTPDITREGWLHRPTYSDAARELPSYNQVFDFTDDETDAGEETDDSVKESNRRVRMFSPTSACQSDEGEPMSFTMPNGQERYSIGVLKLKRYRV